MKNFPYLLYKTFIKLNIFLIKKFKSLYLILIIIIIKTFFYDIYYIPSKSMYPTLNSGDIVLVNKMYYNVRIPILNYIFKIKNPKRKDIVVFKCPFDKKINYIKRVLHIEGDKILGKSNKININSNLNYIKYIYNKYYKNNMFFIKNKKFYDKYSKIIIPKNFCFVVGDNLINSYDSRYWGLLNTKNLIGKATYRIININLYSRKKIVKIIFSKIK